MASLTSQGDPSVRCQWSSVVRLIDLHGSGWPIVAVAGITCLPGGPERLPSAGAPPVTVFVVRP